MIAPVSQQLWPRHWAAITSLIPVLAFAGGLFALGDMSNQMAAFGYNLMIGVNCTLAGSDVVTKEAALKLYTFLK